MGRRVSRVTATMLVLASVAAAAAAKHQPLPAPSQDEDPPRATALDGEILSPGALCEPENGGLLASSVAWRAGPGGAGDGTDGVWFDVAAFGGFSFSLRDAFSSPLNGQPIAEDIRFIAAAPGRTEVG